MKRQILAGLLLVAACSAVRAEQIKVGEPYWYEAEVTRIVDADTIDVRIGLGFHVFLEERLRFARINAWEVKGEEKEKGLEAKAWLESVIPVGAKILIRTFPDEKEKFGRWLAEVWVNGECLNDELVRRGHAKYQEY